MDLLENDFLPINDDLNCSVYGICRNINKANERFENMKGVFKTKHKDGLIGKHVLLVDDVMTTSATLTACADALREIEGIQFSFLTVAISNQL